MSGVLIFILKSLLGGVVSGVLGKIFKNKHTVSILEGITPVLEYAVHTTEAIAICVQAFRDNNLTLAEIVDDIQNNYGVTLSLSEVQGILDKEARTKFELAYRIAKARLELHSIEFTEKLLRLGIELIVNTIAERNGRS